MDTPFYSLKDYPLESHYDACLKYDSHLNWTYLKNQIKENGVIYFDASDCISLFPHLELDENYKFICYLSREYHGIYGHIAAIKDGDNIEPIYTKSTEQMSKLFHGKCFELPVSSVPPLEAVYNDGTPEGYFEAILLFEFLATLPRKLQNYRPTVIETKYPESTDGWDIIVEIPNWEPRLEGSRIIAITRLVENGIGGSDGRDSYFLSQYKFQRNLGMYHAFMPKKERPLYKSQIDDDKRYTKERHCSVFVESSIQIAVGKSIFSN